MSEPSCRRSMVDSLSSVDVLPSSEQSQIEPTNVSGWHSQGNGNSRMHHMQPECTLDHRQQCRNESRAIHATLKPVGSPTDQKTSARHRSTIDSVHRSRSQSTAIRHRQRSQTADRSLPRQADVGWLVSFSFPRRRCSSSRTNNKGSAA